ncbi:MAG: DUF4132 domain-containing protein, partial [Pseudomonadota bacterium]
TLANQYSRARHSLEEAMNRGDEFSVPEIQALSQHPLVSPMLKNLVLAACRINQSQNKTCQVKTKPGRSKAIAAMILTLVLTWQVLL